MKSCLFSDLIIPSLVPLLERSFNNLWPAQLCSSIFVLILAYHLYTVAILMEMKCKLEGFV